MKIVTPLLKKSRLWVLKYNLVKITLFFKRHHVQLIIFDIQNPIIYEWLTF